MRYKHKIFGFIAERIEDDDYFPKRYKIIEESISDESLRDVYIYLEEFIINDENYEKMDVYEM